MDIIFIVERNWARSIFSSIELAMFRGEVGEFLQGRLSAVEVAIPILTARSSTGTPVCKPLYAAVV
jgi:hypothetical protein